MSELTALVRFVHLTAAIILAGGFAFHLFVARPALISTHDLATVRKDHWRTQLRVFRYSLALLPKTQLDFVGSRRAFPRNGTHMKIGRPGVPLLPTDLTGNYTRFINVSG